MTKLSKRLWKRAQKAERRGIARLNVANHGLVVLTAIGRTVVSRNCREQAYAKAARDLDRIGVE